MTEDAHGRRTRLLYQKAFGRRVEVGIISVHNPDYDAKRWWQYSEGVREVLGESIAYLYAKFSFIPPRRGDWDCTSGELMTQAPHQNSAHGDEDRSPDGLGLLQTDFVVAGRISAKLRR